MNWPITLAAVAGGAALYAAARQRINSTETVYEPPTPDPAWGLDAQTGEGTAAMDSIPTDDQTQTASTVQDIFASVTQTTWGSNAADDVSNPNVRAFLDMIAFAEGTAGPDGYLTMFGGALANSYADHPRKRFTFTNSRGETLTTSAAGRYQFLIATWDELKKKLGLPDFSPDSQDRAAIELIRQRGALNDVKAGRVASAITKIAPIWASMPGAGYAQPERKLSALLAAYAQAGGQTLQA